jgi:hypothetical protein
MKGLSMDPRVSTKLKQYGRMVSSKDFHPLAEDLRRWAWSEENAVGLERDLSLTFEPPPARVPVDIRELDDDLAERLFSADGLDEQGVFEMESRRRFWEDRIPTAYVAVAEDVPCYVQWAVPGSQAELIREYFGEGFPHLEPDEILLEGAWARPEARGKRIMAEAMSRITVAAAGTEHRRALTFVEVHNEPSIRGCRAAGYEVFVGRRKTWRLGRRKFSWGPPPPV